MGRHSIPSTGSQNQTFAAKFDQAEIRRSLDLLLTPGNVYELRVPGTRQGTLSGYFDDLQKLALAAANVSGRGPAAYLTLNPVNRDLLARAANRVKPYARLATTDGDVVARHWLTVDLDAVRPSGISSTDSQHAQALDRAKEVRSLLSTSGWPEPILADSGNGGHLIWRVGLPSDSASTQVIAGCLKALSFRFDDETVKIDTGTYNPGRPWKLFGTLVAKGDNTRERPHRIARMLEVPERLDVAPLNLLQALAAILPTQPPRSQTRYQNLTESFNLEAWIAKHGIQVHHSAPWNGGYKYVLTRCPWNEAHTDKAAFILQFADGAIASGCLHASCKGRGWQELKDVVDPEWRDRQVSARPRRPHRQGRGPGWMEVEL